MSYSGSDTSSIAGDYKNFKQITRERLLYEMLRSTKVTDLNSTSKVLIVDKVTLKIFSHCCKMPELTWEGVSLVEDIDRSRQPFPSLMDAIYFIQPTKENVVVFLKDMSGSSPLYKKEFVYFSSPIPRELVVHIKKDASVLPRIGALSEMNLEYFAIDKQSFITDNGRALEDLFGDEENSRKGDACLNVMATRIATVFASLREFPFIRYRAAKSLDPMTLTTFRDIIPTKLAAGIWNCLEKYKSKPSFPQKETCELLILDRSIDQIAPVIHEWTYEAMCHDLLNMEGNKYVHEVPSKTGGPPDKKEVLLEENDPLWLELRHAHIAHAGEMLHEKMINFKSKNKSAQLQHGLREGELSTRELRKMVQALPQYSEQNDNLSLHVEITERIYQIIRDQGLRDLAQLEQDLVFGDAGIKDVIKFLSTNEKASRENKLRLLMILAAIYPEKFEGEEGYNLMKLAKLLPEDITAVNNMILLAPPSSDAKKSSAGAFSWIFDVHKKKHAARKERSGELPYSRFYPIIEELVEKLSKGELSKDDYPCINAPIYEAPAAAQSMRSRSTPTWARSRVSDESVLRYTSSDFKRMSRRIFVFIVGGATRSELRVCRELTRKLNREVILGSTSLDDPPQFITKMKLLTTADVLSLDDLQI